MGVFEVITKDDGFHVILEVTNSGVKTEPLEKFITETIVVNYAGQYRSLKEIIDLESQKFISSRKR